jgi:hypothetical protein
LKSLIKAQNRENNQGGVLRVKKEGEEEVEGRRDSMMPTREQ